MKQLFLSIATFSLISIPTINAQIKDFNKPTDQYFEISKNLEIYSNIFKELNAYYVDPIEPGKMSKTSIDAMLYELDPYTNFYTETDKEDYEFQTTGKYAGIGAGMQIIDSNLFVGEVFENSPVHKAGIKAGDQLIKINDIPVKGKSNDEISLLLKGAPGTDVTLEIKNPKSPTTSIIKVTREAIDIKSVPLYTLVGKNKKIGYINLSQFTSNCSKDIKDALVDLKKQEPNLESIILDLRDNPGGLLGEAVKICNLFLPKGQLIVSTKGKNKQVDHQHVTEDEPWDVNMPLVVLINNGSASASEVVAGTMQDLDRGVVIGVKSFGKGLVQQVKPLGYNTSLKLTIAKYYTPSGRCIQAIDYSHRNPDGSVSSVPDSLKKEFKTKVGRIVFDGGGIDPDIATKDMDVNRTLIALMNDGQIFDFATDYFYKNKTIANAEEFYVTDKDFEAFMQFIESKKYTYESLSENVLKTFEEILKQEKYVDDVKGTIEKLKKDISVGKQNSLKRSKDDIKLLLSNEIVSRYYFQRGRVVNRLYHSDNELDKALEILADIDTKYKPILKQ